MRLWLYHKKEAPEGRLFDNVQKADVDKMLSEGWKDTPAGFNDPDPEPQSERVTHDPDQDDKTPEPENDPEFGDAVDLGDMTEADARKKVVEGMDKDELRAALDSLGIEVHHNTGEDKLRAALLSYYED